MDFFLGAEMLGVEKEIHFSNTPLEFVPLERMQQKFTVHVALFISPN